MATDVVVKPGASTNVNRALNRSSIEAQLAARFGTSDQAGIPSP